MPAAFDREYERVRSDIRTLSERLRGIQIRRGALERRSEEARQRQYGSLKASRFIGNLEESLQTYARIGKDSELDDEVRELQDRVIHWGKQHAGSDHDPVWVDLDLNL